MKKNQIIKLNININQKGFNMLNTIDKTLNLQYKIVEGVIDGEEFGESLNGHDYHILIKLKKKKQTICVVYHLPHITCEFCKLEKINNEPFIWL